MNDDDIRREFLTKLAVPVWPVAGKALGLGTTRRPHGSRSWRYPYAPMGRQTATRPHLMAEAGAWPRKSQRSGH
jgi:hypothetical protein